MDHSRQIKQTGDYQPPGEFVPRPPEIRKLIREAEELADDIKYEWRQRGRK